MNGDCPERCPKSEERTAAFDDHECKTSDFSRACALQGEDSIGKVSSNSPQLYDLSDVPPRLLQSDIAEDHYTSIPLLPSSSQHRRLTEAHVRCPYWLSPMDCSEMLLPISLSLLRSPSSSITVRR